jgi:NADH-quinone oxidoreductase subunit K
MDRYNKNIKMNGFGYN